MGSTLAFLVTGAFGVLASRLLARLAEEEPAAQIIAVGRPGGRRAALPAGIQLVHGDLCDRGVWTALPRTTTHVFHLAAAIPWRPEQKTQASVVTDNLVPLGHLLEQSHSWPGLSQIVFASSVAVYGWTQEVLREDAPKRPVDLYGATKLAGENLLLAAAARGVRVSCLRYSSLFGRGQYSGTVIPTMIRSAIERNRICVWGGGRRSQDFLHYDDAAEAAFLACRHGAVGAFNVGSGNAVSMTDLAELIAEVFTAGRAAVVHDWQVPESDPGFRLDVSKAAEELSFRARRDLRAGLAQLRRDLERG
jgi:UDP-glucose 4-epimerase